MSARRLLHLLEGLGAVIVHALLRLLPLDAASALGGFLGRSIGRHLGVSRQALRNLRLAMPEIGAVEGWRVIRGMWDNLGRVIAEYPHLDKYVSLVNLASVSMLGKVMDVAVDPMRFRANFYLSGVDEWKERDWLGREDQLGRRKAACCLGDHALRRDARQSGDCRARPRHRRHAPPKFRSHQHGHLRRSA
jgi:hypothetical protein